MSATYGPSYKLPNDINPRRGNTMSEVESTDTAESATSTDLFSMDLETQEHIEGWLFIMGKLLLVLLVFAFPLVFGVYVSFTHSTLVNLPGEFIGLDNYIWLLQYDVWWTAVKNVLIIGIVLIPTNIFFALTTSLLLTEKLRGNYLYRVAYIVPIAGPPLIWAIVWKFIFFPAKGGILNSLLLILGILNNPIGWTGSTTWALPAVIITLMWGFGLSMLIYLAALSGLPEELIDASKMDGAGRWHRLRYIIWPLLKPTTFFLVVVQLINIFRLGFSVVYVLTQGGPLNSTAVPSYFIYSIAFNYNSFGKSAAASMVMFLLTVLITLLLWKPLQSRAEYYQ
jgi:multiple sugar transport system permease protein